MKRIGIFDSGIGGKSIEKAISIAHPEYYIVYRQDPKNAPYGDKTKQELLQLTIPFIKEFMAKNCDAIVIACNTVTTATISELRELTNIPIIGIEPMVKPAAQSTKSKKIAVCATPATLQSKRYEQLKAQYAHGVKVLEPDCSQWAKLIESNKVNESHIAEQIHTVCKQNVDVIVLGCTHYHWIEQEVKDVANQYGVSVLQPEQAIVSRLEQVLAQIV